MKRILAALLLLALGFALYRSFAPTPAPVPAPPAADLPPGLPAPEAPSAPPAPSSTWREPLTGDALIAAVTDPDHPRRKWLAVYDLPGPRTARETAALLAYLTDHPVGQYGYRGEEYAHRNYIMDVLREQRDAWPHVVTALARVYADPRQGDTLRGYALQHLASLYLDRQEDLAADQRGEIVATLRAALPERGHGTLAATALVGLHEIARADPNAVPSAEIEAWTLELLRDPGSGPLTKISALQIAGERKLAQAAPEARRWAADPAQDWVVRMASAYLLGRIGTDPALLRRLSQDPDENARGAARAALSRKESGP